MFVGVENQWADITRFLAILPFQWAATVLEQKI